MVRFLGFLLLLSAVASRAQSVPVINTFTATPQTITVGQNSLLSWSTKGATMVSINQGLGKLNASGAVSVTPAETTSFLLTASGPGGVAHATVTVAVLPPATVIEQPQDQITTTDQTATFSVTASGPGPLTYQWQFRPAWGGGDFLSIPGATSSTYTFTNAQTLDQGAQFRAVISGPDGTVISDPARLNVRPPACGMADVICVGSGQTYATIQSAANVAQPGNTVLVLDGVYAGFFAVNSGTLTSPIVFMAANGNAIINSSNSNTPDNVNVEFSDESLGYTIVDGFTVLNSARAGIRSANATGVVIENNVIGSSAMWGILTGFTPRIQILNNQTFNTVGQHGIYVSNSDVSNDDPVLRGNESYGNAQNGIQLNGDCTTLDANGYSDGVISGAVLEDNLVHDNGEKGLSLIDVQTSTVQNNVIYNNGLQGGAGGIHLAEQDTCNDPSSNNVIVNNTIVEPNIAAIRITTGTDNAVFNNIAVSGEPIVDESGGPNSIDTVSNIQTGSTASLFVNPAAGNYHLAFGSKAIGAGVAFFAGRRAPEWDFDGNPRPRQDGMSSGAYQFGYPTILPIFTSQPRDSSVRIGQMAAFSVTVIGTRPFSYQWQVRPSGAIEFTSIPGATAAAYNFIAQTVSESGNEYRCVVTNFAGSSISGRAQLTVSGAPWFTQQPQSLTVSVGQSATFSATALGDPAPSYQWQSEPAGSTTFSNISGGTSATYAFSPQLSDNGSQYQCVASNGAGSATSLPATLTVIPAGCLLGNATSWVATPITPETGSFEIQFDATPEAADETGALGLSTNPAAAYTDMAVIVRFNSTGDIDARNGGSYQAASTISYAPDTLYHFRLDVNVVTHTYSAYVTPAGSSELTIGSNFAFRTEQAMDSNLAYFNIAEDLTLVCNVVIH